MNNENIYAAIATLPLGASLDIFTDGASKSNPGNAGFGLVAIHADQSIHSASGHIGKASNVVAEMTAAIEALKLLQPRPDLVATIISDNQMLVRGMTEWLPGWKARGWRKADKKPLENLGLWKTLEVLAAGLPGLRWLWVRGHKGNKWNEMADALASGAALSGVSV